jgi:ribose-phosphate pyrophosphokinase
MDVHNPSVTAFFDVPTDHLTAMPVFVEYCRNAFELGSCVVASPDFGGLKRARLFADALDVPLVNLEKSRNLQSGKIEEMELHGDVRGKNVVVYDDLINTGSTIVAVTASLRAAGAKSVHFCATHALLVGNATQNIVDSHIDSIIVTNTIAHHALPPSIKVLDCSGVFARALQPWLAK